MSLRDFLARILALSVSLICTLTISACGQKGPLVDPQPTQQEETRASAG